MKSIEKKFTGDFKLKIKNFAKSILFPLQYSQFQHK